MIVSALIRHIVSVNGPEELLREKIQQVQRRGRLLIFRSLAGEALRTVHHLFALSCASTRLNRA